MEAKGKGKKGASSPASSYTAHAPVCPVCGWFFPPVRQAHCRHCWRVCCNQCVSSHETDCPQRPEEPEEQKEQ